LRRARSKTTRAPHGKFKDKPDIVIVVDWEPGQPPPTPGTTGIKFIVLEHCFAHDFHLAERRVEKAERICTLHAPTL
jgi:hypothetical protein